MKVICKSRYVLATFWYLWSLSGYSQILNITGEGQFQFSAAISEDTACELAKEKMVKNALRSQYGERIEFDEFQSCSNEILRERGVACHLSQRIFFSSNVDLSVLNIQIKKRDVFYPKDGGAYTCSVKGIVRFEHFPLKMDEDWATDFGVEELSFEGPEIAVSFRITSSKDGYHYVFEDLGLDGFKLIYPNRFDPPKNIRGSFLVPTNSAKRPYVLTLENAAKSIEEERIFLHVSTKSQLKLDFDQSGRFSRSFLNEQRDRLKAMTWTQKKLAFKVKD